MALVATVACDSDSKTESKPASAETPEAKTSAPAKSVQPPAKAAPNVAPAEPEAPAVEVSVLKVSVAMKAFMSELGEHDKVTAAIKKHGAGGLEADMGMYNIAEPTVTAAEPGQAKGETCYAMQAKTGAVRRKFRVCWKGDKITAAENKGLAL
ncbi:MAG: hypothetical protein JKY37_12300 [Nannocystaceae bacterium]|nr:hypothetical protein [Nannocystaceae bacterium]